MIELLTHIKPALPLYSLTNIAVSVEFLKMATMVAIISCTIILLVILGFVLVRRIRRNIRNRFQQLFRKWLANAIVQLALEPNQPFVISPQLDKLLRKRYHRLLALNELLICKKYLKGHAMKMVVQLYEQLQLRKETDQKLKSLIWSRVVRGIQEIYVFDQYDAMDQLLAFADDDNPYVRSEAHFGLVNLQGFEALRFLKLVRNNLSDWDQINLLHQLTNFEPKPLMQMPEWLVLENESVVLFALKLLQAYPDQAYYEPMIACLQQDNENIRAQAIRCCSLIYQADTTNVLEAQFEKETIHLQLVILQTMKLLQQAPKEAFLLQQLNHPDDRVKQLATELMGTKYANGLELLQKAWVTDAEKQQQLIKHLQVPA